MRLGALFVESMKAQGLRNLAARLLFEELKAKMPRSCAVQVDLQVDVLQVGLSLWWPWLLLLGFAHVYFEIRARLLIRAGLLKLKIPMRMVRVRVVSRRKRVNRK